MDTLCGFDTIFAFYLLCHNIYYFRKSFFVLYSQKSNHFGTINAFKITNVILDNTKIEFCMYFSQYIKINVLFKAVVN